MDEGLREYKKGGEMRNEWRRLGIVKEKSEIEMFVGFYMGRGFWNNKCLRRDLLW